MDKKEFQDEMLKYAQVISLKLSEKQLNQFWDYMNLLLEWNEKINLTAIIEPKEIILKHFIDSLTILKYIDKNKKVIDIGTGAGFPGIPLKIMREDIEVTLLDSLNKRIQFLNEVIMQLKLEKIYTVHSRIEDYGRDKKYRESYDFVTSRAVANLSTLSEYMLPMIKVEGKSICMKGVEIEDELTKSKNAIKILGGKVVQTQKLNLPKSDNGRNLIIIEKVKNTPTKYPRKAGVPSKTPIS